MPSKPLTPDQYKQYALQDPGFLGLQSALQGNEDSFQAQARGGINKGVVGLGLAPTDSSLASWLDPGTADAAAQNPLSTGAGLTLNHQANMRNIQNSLAARGGYDSGELTYGLQNEDTRDTQARASALSSFMDYANGLFGQLGTMKAQDASQLGQELGNAAMRQLALHPGETTSAVWDDSRGAYIDSNGNAYDQWGNPITSTGGGDTPPTTHFGASSALIHPPTVSAGGYQAPLPNSLTGAPNLGANTSIINSIRNQPPVVTHGSPVINAPGSRRLF